MKPESKQSFIVVSGDLRLRVTPDSGWYIAESLDVRGLNAQGKTVEEVITNAHEVARLLAEDRTELVRKAKADTRKKDTPAKRRKVTA